MSTEISALNNRPVIIGGGAAGLMTALHLAPEPVLLLSKAPLGAEASSLWAQGGLAAAMGGDDAPALHLADTLAAGAGLCDEAVAKRIRTVEIIPGKGSGQLKKHVLRFLEQKEIKALYHRIDKDSDNFGRLFVHFRFK